MRTVNLELSRKLKEAGYPQEDNAFYWITSPWNGKSEVIYYQDREQLKDDFIDKRYNLVASPTADEILEQLPSKVKRLELSIYKDDREGFKKWEISYTPDNDDRTVACYEDDSLADAAAKMWLYLKQNNLLQKEGKE